MTDERVQGMKKAVARRRSVAVTWAVVLTADVVLAAPRDTTCYPDAVRAGSVCMDRYEASVWQIPSTNAAGKSNAALITKVKGGTATLADLTDGNATEISPAFGCMPAFPATFPANGQWTQPLYAASVAGVPPTACVTWFQAQQACANSGKRLPTNAEWQLAVAGTPDPGSDNGTSDCNTGGMGAVVNTGSRSSCVSNWGAHDMIGNVYERVADWVPVSTDCPGWGAFSSTGDNQCFAGASTSTVGGPAALVRGGVAGQAAAAGPLTVDGDSEVSFAPPAFGFRCAR